MLCYVCTFASTAACGSGLSGLFWEISQSTLAHVHAGLPENLCGLLLLGFVTYCQVFCPPFVYIDNVHLPTCWCETASHRHGVFVVNWWSLLVIIRVIVTELNEVHLCMCNCLHDWCSVVPLSLSLLALTPPDKLQ